MAEGYAVALRELPVKRLEEEVSALLTRAASHLPEDYLEALKRAEREESSELGRSVIRMLLENACYAEREGMPTCQDTGMAVLILEVGQDVRFVGGDIREALENAVREGYKDLRKSVVTDPLKRKNTGDNTPPIVHYDIVPGDKVKVTALMKGFGAELMSRLVMLPPSAGLEGVKRFVLETVEKAGPNACPPVIVGVGLGSSFDGVAYLAKKALARPLGSKHPEGHLAALEADLLEEINRLGVGPQGFGGKITALAVHIESHPTHIAALPVAVNLNCSAPRRATVVLQMRKITAPFDDKTVLSLRAGDLVEIGGRLITARDAAHKRLVETLKRGEGLPVALNGEVIYYVGPAPAKPGSPVGSAGPTTSGRMDPYTVPLLERGVKGLIGKGYRSEEVKEALKKYRAVYFAAVGGAAALLAQRIKSSRVIAYEDLGTEAIHEFIVENFPVVVVNDAFGDDAYESGRLKHLEETS